MLMSDESIFRCGYGILRGFDHLFLPYVVDSDMTGAYLLRFALRSLSNANNSQFELCWRGKKAHEAPHLA